MTCYVHSVPGRLRVRMPAAKGNSIVAAKFVTRLTALEGITSVTANAATGSILIHYDTATTDAAACLEVLDVQVMRQPDTVTARSSKASPPGRRLASKAVEAATWFVLERLFERCFPLIFAALF